MGELSQGPPRPPRNCRHSSLRSDDWLDDRCLRCGAKGVWRMGEPVPARDIVATQVHPSGKTLARTSDLANQRQEA
jgi:hypothetical protein